MTTVKDLLLQELTSKGFIYYPGMKRLMHKTESAEKSSVTVIEMSNDKECRVFFSSKDNNTAEYTDNRLFGYDVDTILRYLNKLTDLKHLAIA